MGDSLLQLFFTLFYTQAVKVCVNNNVFRFEGIIGHKIDYSTYLWIKTRVKVRFMRASHVLDCKRHVLTVNNNTVPYLFAAQRFMISYLSPVITQSTLYQPFTHQPFKLEHWRLAVIGYLGGYCNTVLQLKKNLFLDFFLYIIILNDLKCCTL